MNEPTSPIVEGSASREMTRWEILCARLRQAWFRLRRRLPHLVWYGDELDVVVTLSQHKLQPTTDIGDALGQLCSDSVYKVEQALAELGISFDRGMGCHGRDWEWDWSLKGPISVRFRSVATKPELRLERPRPYLVTKSGERVDL